MQPPIQISIDQVSASDAERHLVSAVLRKDRKATAEFVSRCADWAYPYIQRRLMPNSEAVEDLMQEVLLAAWRGLPAFRGSSGLQPWIIGIARHKVEDYYRKRLMSAELPEEDTHALEPAVPPIALEQLERTSLHDKVRQTLGHLPEAYGLALLWRYRDNRTVREIAQETGKTEKAIERLLARAREAFRRNWRND